MQLRRVMRAIALLFSLMAGLLLAVLESDALIREFILKSFM
jgi:hypothetical protein